MPFSPLARVQVVALVLASAALPGCFGPTTGSYGVLAFEYRAEDDLFGDQVATAIAVGATVDLDVFAGKGTRERLAREKRAQVPGDAMLHGALPREPRRSSLERAAVLSARIRPREVAEMISIGPGRVRVRGIAPGPALVRVVADGGDDAILIHVEAVDHVEVSHWALLDKVPVAPPVWVKGGTGRFLLAARDAKDRRLLGFAEPPPLAVQPEGAAVVEHAPADLHHVDVRFAAAGEVTLEPRPGKPVRVRVVEPQAITSLEIRGARGLLGAPSPLLEVDSGRDLFVHVLGSLGQEKVLLLGNMATIQAGPPAVCAVVPAGGLALARRVFGDGFEGVHAVAPGKCVVEASLGARTARAEIVVTPPDSRERGSWGRSPHREQPSGEPVRLTVSPRSSP